MLSDYAHSHSRLPPNACAVEPANYDTLDELVMALQKEHTAFGRIVQFDDNKTEQVWDVFRDELGRASVAEDGVTGWRIAYGTM